ncbi:Conjugal transfer pilus assembly protein Tra (plasmid) [Candidatus Trichorickettsia mobilis]|uniref:conjugal transfer protein TraW n=1 Tax=Candidatus Trichorickettsia mobilis TaxID=1346319 RepID=UPI002B25F3BA|nr:conjugal transfer protein TraW [Candidatus Trichorickettsia mobilis]WPY01928.1 Conjugal transfer pilus assembly protein Tra [Candidatus Trichorickettsia mobilis]
MRNKSLLLIVVFSLSNPVFGKDFGKQGATFEIKEEGFVSMMQRKLKGVNLAEHEQKMKDLARKRVEEPTPVFGITRATRTVSHSFDPSYVLDEDVFLPCGKLLYPAGTRVNPLDHMEWGGKIVFIDGRDSSQIAWLKDNYMKSNEAFNKNKEELPQNLGDQNKDNAAHTFAPSDNKIILTGGRPLELEREVENPIYFDQFGELTNKFNIAHVPAIVEPEGKYLKVTEINIGGR